MGNNGKQWSGRSRGGGFGYNFFILLMKVAGIRSAYAFLSLVVVYFIPYAHYYALGQTIIDRVAIGSGMERKYKFEFENYDAFLRVLDGGRGAVIIGAHVGCWGTGAGFFGDYARKMHLVMYDAEYRQIKSVMEKHCGQEGYKVIAVNEGGIESILRIKEVLDRKEYVCFQGDRFVEERGRRYRFIFDIPDEDGCGTKEAILGSYVRSLEAVVRRYPQQWFNFYRFWS